MPTEYVQFRMLTNNKDIKKYSSAYKLAKFPLHVCIFSFRLDNDLTMGISNFSLESLN